MAFDGNGTLYVADAGGWLMYLKATVHCLFDYRNRRKSLWAIIKGNRLAIGNH